MWALVLNALLPLAGHAAVRLSGAAQWQEICTSAGKVRVGTSAPGYDLAQHCPDCTLHGGAAGLPPSGVTFVPASFAVMPSAFYEAERTASVWLATQSRAPPFAV